MRQGNPAWSSPRARCERGVTDGGRRFTVGRPLSGTAPLHGTVPEVSVGGRVRRIGRVIEVAPARDDGAATFTVEGGVGPERVRVVGREAARRARALAAGTRVVVDGRWLASGGILLAHSVQPVA